MPKIVDHEVRRNEISAAAAFLIAQGGLEGATIREIAKSSGYSKGVVEHYFENKEELIRGALDWANRQYQQREEKATAGLSGLQALRKRIEAILPMNKSMRDEWKVRLVFWSVAAIKSDLKKEQGNRFQQSVRHFERDIVAAISLGEISSSVDSSAQARHVLNMTTGISIAALHNLQLYTRKQLLAEVDYLIDQLAHT